MSSRASLILLAVCSLTAAMVPRERRLEDLSSTNSMIPSAGGSPSSGIKFCAEQTPCAWSVYNSYKTVFKTLDNIYCICKDGVYCVKNEDDLQSNTYIHRCRAEETVFHS